MLNVDSKTNVITLTRGDTARIQVNITDATGQPYVPQDGDVIRFALKKRYADDTPLINITIPNDTLLLEISPSDTKPLRFGTYKYDIQITMANGTVDTFIDRGQFVITEEVE